MALDTTNNFIIEENEFYSFHRHAMRLNYKGNDHQYPAELLTGFEKLWTNSRWCSEGEAVSA